VKVLLSEQPGLLEKGLGLYADEEGEPLGIDFPTPVGSIDLLCRDRKGGFVVVHLPARDEVDESVSAMLRRMGWVRKHLAGGGEDVRGVVVLDQLPEALAYAAAGAAGSIAFKGYQLQLTFHDLEA
jgi:RecB family endonuclease NucS